MGHSGLFGSAFESCRTLNDCNLDCPQGTTQEKIDGFEGLNTIACAKKMFNGREYKYLRRGPFVQWSYDGTLKQIRIESGNVPDGPMIDWHSTGAIAWRGEYRRGSPCGRIEVFNSEGTPIPAEGIYQNLYHCTITATGADCAPCR